MKVIHSNQVVIIPPGLEASVKSRKVIVKGPRGVLRREFKHLAVDIRKEGKNKIVVEKWFGIKRELAAVRTVAPTLRTCSRELPRDTNTRCDLSMLISQLTLPFLRAILWSKYATSLARNLHEKFVCFLVSPVKHLRL